MNKIKSLWAEFGQYVKMFFIGFLRGFLGYWAWIGHVLMAGSYLYSLAPEWAERHMKLWVAISLTLGVLSFGLFWYVLRLRMDDVEASHHRKYFRVA